MLSGQPVTVLGAGIGGLATALALSRRGAKVRVLEQASEIAEVGAGLQITPNGIAVLDALGLGDKMRQCGVVARAIELRDFARGALVVRLDLARHAADQTYLLLHRADLIGELASAAERVGISINFDHQVNDLSPDENGVRITFSNGRTEECQLVIAADGLHSRLRAVLNGDQVPFFTRQVAWRAIVPSTTELHGVVHVHMGPGRHIVSYPLRGGAMTNIVAVQERKGWADEGWHHPGDPDELRRAFADFCPQVQELLEKVDEVSLWGLFRHPVARRWHGARCALVGDAAHPTLPFLAQGANLALEDAWVIASCLAREPIEQALATYQLRRQARVSKVIAAANANARNYHLRNPAIRLAAHSLLRVAGALAPAQMLSRFDWIYGFDVTAQ